MSESVGGLPSNKKKARASEVKGLETALLTVEEQVTKLQDEGMSKLSFFLGVLNMAFTCLVLAGAPAYFFILYTVKCWVLIPLWGKWMHRHHNGVLYLLDFCWVANVTFALYMLLLGLDVIPMGVRKDSFVIFYAVALGPLAWASLLLHNGLVFHSVAHITSLFVHISPTLLCFTVMAAPEQVAERWPGRFPTPDELQEVTLKEMYMKGLCFYTAWWLLHSVWLVAVGVDAPAKGQDTVFEDLYKKNKLNHKFARLSGSPSIRVHAVMYLVIHYLLVMLSFVSPLLVFPFNAWTVHFGFSCLLFISAAWSGASYYEYILSRKYAGAIKKLLPTPGAEPATPIAESLTPLAEGSSPNPV